MNHWSLLIFSLFISSYACERKIYSYLNPNCTDCNTSNITLIYTKAVGSHDILHQIWDFTKGFPTVIFVIAGINSTLNITWNENLKPEIFSMNEVPKYSFAAVIDKIYEYNDTDDTCQINKGNKKYSLWDVSWQRTNIVLTKERTMIKIRSDGWFLGTVEIKLDFLNFKDKAKELPHLIHTTNSSLFDISLVNLTKSFKNSRFALHYLLASTDDQDDTMHYTVRKSLDDEHTPGIFEVIEIKTPESYRNDDGGFLQFRPVAYTQPERGVTTSSNLRVIGFDRDSLPIKSTARKFYKQMSAKNPLVQNMLVSFGDPGDGFYKAHNYTAWSYTIGYGKPPVEGFSLFVIVIISTGLGIPVLLGLIGITILIVKRYRQNRNTPSRLIEDQ